MIAPDRILFSLLQALAERRLAAGAMAAVLVVFAAIALIRMPVQLLPEVRYPQIRIISDLPGQTSTVIEETINEPLEAALAGVPGIARMESRSGDSRAYIDLFFDPGYDLDRALIDVTQSVERVRGQIPAEFPPPRVFAVSTLEVPAMQIAFGSSSVPVKEIRKRLRTYLLPRLRAVEGVDAMYIGREEIPELVVDIDPHQQTTLGVNLTSLESFLREATETPAGSVLRSADFEGIGILEDGGWDAAWLENRILLAGATATPVPLQTIARVHLASSEERLHTRLDGRAAVLVTVHRSPHAHALSMADEVKSVLSEVTSSAAFADLEATLLYDDSIVTRSAVRSVLVAAIGGAVLAMLLIFVTLRQRSHVLLVGIVVLVSLSGAVVVLHGLGMTLNLLTLAGLLLSVGLGLDYAIIYFDRLDRIGGDTDAPHIRAMTEVAGPLLGALLTTLAAISPFLLVQGMLALLFRPLILTVLVAAVFSFAVAIVLLPVFARAVNLGRTDHAPRPAPSPSGWWRIARAPVFTWTSVLILSATLYFGGRALPFEVLPTVDDGFVGMRLTHPVGIPLAKMDDLSRKIEDRLMAIDGTAAVFSTVGGYFREGLPAFRPGTTDFMVQVDTAKGRLPSMKWAEAARRSVAEMDIPDLRLAVTLPQIRGVRTRLSDGDLIVVLTRHDGDLLALREVETRVAEILAGIDGLIDIERVRGGVSPRWTVRPNYAGLAAYGIQPSAFRQLMTYTLEGKVLRERIYSGEPLALRARYDRRFSGGPHHLEEAQLPALSGGFVHLGDVAEFEFVEEPTHIERRESQRVRRVMAQLHPSGPGPERVAAQVKHALSQGGLPPEVSWWIEGEIEALEETRSTFAISLGLALLLVLALLVIQYGSLSLAAAGLVTIPLSASGVVLLLSLLGRPLDAMVLAGLLIAVGIVANNVILVLSEAQAGMREGRTPISDALYRAARNRFRPISLTVLSTVFGMAPLLFGGAEVFGLLQPLAIALTGSLLLSIPLACVILPGLAASFSPASSRQRNSGS